MSLSEPLEKSSGAAEEEVVDTIVAAEAEQRLGMRLVEQGLMSAADFERVAYDASRSGVPLTRLLIETGRVAESDVLRTVATELGVPFCDVGNGFVADARTLTCIDRETARSLQSLPYATDESGRIQVAVADPTNDQRRKELSAIIGSDVELALASERGLSAAIDRAYDGVGGAAGGSEVLGEFETAGGHIHINELLERLWELGGSDLHVTAGSPPQVRVNGSLVPLDEFGMMKPDPLQAMIYDILTQRQKQELEEERELDCSHPLPGKGRFRVNVFFQRDSIGAVMRAIPNEIVPLTKLGMPPVVADFATLSRGMVLVTGPTGSGKSTTLASLIDLINSTRADHIMTVEDPIEFIHRHKMSIVNQREVGSDTLSFAAALRHALRQDPDVILVGEMRDLETIATAITAAETGHLVFATLHTQDAPKSVERMIDVFPSHQQQQVRVQLASSLQAVVAQQLLPLKNGKGRVAAVEVMVATPAIRNLVREGKVHQIATSMQAGGKYGMQTMDMSLAGLVKDGTVDYRIASERAHDLDGFANLLGERYRR